MFSVDVRVSRVVNGGSLLQRDVSEGTSFIDPPPHRIVLFFGIWFVLHSCIVRMLSSVIEELGLYRSIDKS
jgi:hypothetical protein